MNFWQSAKNFITGHGWQDDAARAAQDEEEKKRKAALAAAQAQQKAQQAAAAQAAQKNQQASNALKPQNNQNNSLALTLNTGKKSDVMSLFKPSTPTNTVTQPNQPATPAPKPAPKSVVTQQPVKPTQPAQTPNQKQAVLAAIKKIQAGEPATPFAPDVIKQAQDEIAKQNKIKNPLAVDPFAKPNSPLAPITAPINGEWFKQNAAKQAAINKAAQEASDKEYFDKWSKQLENGTEADMHPTALGKAKETVLDYIPLVGSARAIDKYRGFDDSDKEHQLVAISRTTDIPISQLRQLNDSDFQNVKDQVSKMRIIDNAGAGVDIASLAAGLFTAGTGAVAVKAAAAGGSGASKAAIKAAVKDTVKGLIKNYIKNTLVSAPVGVGVNAAAQKYLTGDVNWNDAVKGGVQGALIGSAVDPVGHIDTALRSVRAVKNVDVSNATKEIETEGLSGVTGGITGTISSADDVPRSRITDIFRRNRGGDTGGVDITTPNGKAIQDFVKNETDAIQTAVKNNPNMTKEQLRALVDDAKARITTYKEALANNPNPEQVISDLNARQASQLNDLKNAVSTTDQAVKEQTTPPPAQDLGTANQPNQPASPELTANNAFDDINENDAQGVFENAQNLGLKRVDTGQTIKLQGQDGTRYARVFQLENAEGKRVARNFLVDNSTGIGIGNFSPRMRITKDFVDENLISQLEKWMADNNIKFTRTSKTIRGGDGGTAGAKYNRPEDRLPYSGRITVRTGSEAQTLYHEIGHQTDEMLHLQDKLYAGMRPNKSTYNKAVKELPQIEAAIKNTDKQAVIPDLIALRDAYKRIIESRQITAKRGGIEDASGAEHLDDRYVGSPEEQIASMFQMYLTRRDEFAREYPTLFKSFDEALASDARTAPLRDAKPSLTLGSRTTSEFDSGSWQDRRGNNYKIQDITGDATEMARVPSQTFNQRFGIQDVNANGADYETISRAVEKLAGNKEFQNAHKATNLWTKFTLNNKAARFNETAVDTVQKPVESIMNAAMNSQNPAFHFLADVAYGFNRGNVTPARLKQLIDQVEGRMGGTGSLIDELVTQSRNILKDSPDPQASVDKVMSAFQEYNDYHFNQASKIIESFTPEEKEYFEFNRALNIVRNTANYRQLSPETAQAFANGMHMPRIYDMKQLAEETGIDPEEIARQFLLSKNKTLDLNPTKRRKQLQDVSKELAKYMVSDPTYASAIRTEIAMHNLGLLEYTDQLKTIPKAVSTTKLRGYLEIPNVKRYGELAGKFVRKDYAEPILSGQDRFESGIYKATNHFLDQINNEMLGGAVGKTEAFLRQTATVFNPATALGNKGANFANLTAIGIDPVTLGTKWNKTMRVLAKGGNSKTRFAQQSGLQMNQAQMRMQSGITQLQATGKWNPLRKAQENYGNTDVTSRYVLWESLYDGGMDAKTAARVANNLLPNIANSGEIFTFFSKLPVIGTAFRAIQPEVYRAWASVATRRIVPFLIMSALFTTAQNMSWNNVPQDERDQIDNAYGNRSTPVAPLIDFFKKYTGVDLSNIGGSGVGILAPNWNINIGDKDKANVIDLSRMAGIYSINSDDTSGNEAVDVLNKVSPTSLTNILTTGQTNNIGNRTFNPIIQLFQNRDYRNKSITNPDATNANLVDPDTGQPLPTDVLSNLNGRVAQFGAQSVFPVLSSVDSVVAAGQNREDFSGADRTLPQAIANFFGIRNKQYTTADLEQAKQNNQNYQIRQDLEKEIATYSPEQQAKIRALSGYYNTDTKLTGKDATTGEEYQYYKNYQPFNWTEDKYKELAGDPVVFKFMSDRAVKQKQMYGTPIPPYLDPTIPEDIRLLVINDKMLAPGEDAEADQKLYSMPGYDLYQQKNKQYQEEANAYYGSDSGNDNTLVKNQDEDFPTKPAAYQAYTDAYQKFADGQGNKPEFTDAVKAAKDQYDQETFAWTNRARVKRGLTPIPWEMWQNDTFGYNPNADSGYGGFDYGYNPTSGIGLSAPDLQALTGISSGSTKPSSNFDKMLQSLIREYGNTQSSIKVGGASNYKG